MIELDPDTEIVESAAFPLVVSPARPACMPGSLVEGHELHRFAVSTNQQMCRDFQAFEISKVGMGRKIKGIGEQALDGIATEHPRLLDLLLRGRDRHEDHAGLAEMPAHEGDTLSVVPCRGRNEKVLFRSFTHGIEGPAQLIGSHRAQIFAFEPYIRTVQVGQMRVA